MTHHTEHVSRIADLLDRSDWIDGDNSADTQAVARAMLTRMVADGVAPEKVHALAYVARYGSAALVDLLDFHTIPEDDDQPGDVWETGNGVTIRTPGGMDWHLSEDQALALSVRLTSAVHDRLTRLYSNEGTSTILSRGRHHHGEDQ